MVMRNISKKKRDEMPKKKEWERIGRIKAWRNPMIMQQMVEENLNVLRQRPEAEEIKNGLKLRMKSGAKLKNIKIEKAIKFNNLISTAKWMEQHGKGKAASECLAEAKKMVPNLFKK